MFKAVMSEVFAVIVSTIIFATAAPQIAPIFVVSLIAGSIVWAVFNHIEMVGSRQE